MTVVIPLGKGSRHKDMELRYALRSIEKHLIGYTNIVIVGECPSWLQNVIHIPFKDGLRKQLNIRDKVLAACADERVSQEFIFTNDDIFLLQNLNSWEILFWHNGDLSQNKEIGAPRLLKMLKTKNFTTYNMDIHAPVVYDKDKFVRVCGWYDWSRDLVIKSMYLNSVPICEGSFMPDLKINTPCTYESIQQQIKDRLFFSVGDRGLNKDMFKVLEELFPSKSKYEK